MKTVKHEIKLERSVKIILGVLALGIFLNAFANPIAQEMFGIKDALADYIDVNGGIAITSWPSGYLNVSCSGCS